MVAYNFSIEFADLVASGKKCQTIRQSLRCKVGDRLQLYTGQRTKECRKLITPDPVCINTQVIMLLLDDFGAISDDFAQADGFKDGKEMQFWFRNKYQTPVFRGVLIKWAAAEAGNE